MLAQISSFFSARLNVSTGSATSDQAAINLAVAALLIEVSRADHDLDDRERRVMLETLESHLKLDRRTLDELMGLAAEEVEQSVSLYQFTRLVNTHYEPPQKLALISAMWRVAYADGEIDKYEDHLIRRVAELIHVSHSEFIRMKLQVAPSS